MSSTHTTHAALRRQALLEQVYASTREDLRAHEARTGTPSFEGGDLVTALLSALRRLAAIAGAPAPREDALPPTLGIATTYAAGVVWRLAAELQSERPERWREIADALVSAADALERLHGLIVGPGPAGRECAS